MSILAFITKFCYLCFDYTQSAQEQPVSALGFGTDVSGDRQTHRHAEASCGSVL